MRRLPESQQEENNVHSNEMVTACFNPKDDQMIVSLSGSPDWHILLWNLKKGLLGKIHIGLSAPVDNSQFFQITFNPHDTSAIVVTGPNTYKYIRSKQPEGKEKDLKLVLKAEHTQINNMEESRNLSNNYTCHAWSEDTGRILVCTDNGEMIICENTGEFKAYVLQSPVGSSIDSIHAFSNGFFVCTGTKFFIFKSSMGDDRAPLRKTGERLSIQMEMPSQQHAIEGQKIRSFVVNYEENAIFAITDGN